MQRLCVISDGSGCWMIYCDCANYLLIISSPLLQSHVQSFNRNLHPAQLQEINLKTKPKTKVKPHSQVCPYFNASTCRSLGRMLHPRKAQENRIFPSVYSESVFQGQDLENALLISFNQLIVRSTLEDHKQIKATQWSHMAGQGGDILQCCGNRHQQLWL